jgi:hypothetical protein
MDIYRRTDTEQISGTVNLRSYLRTYMSAESVNRALVDLWKHPYSTLYLATCRYGVDLHVDVHPASGQFRIVTARW